MKDKIKQLKKQLKELEINYDCYKFYEKRNDVLKNIKQIKSILDEIDISMR